VESNKMWKKEEKKKTKKEEKNSWKKVTRTRAYFPAFCLSAFQLNHSSNFGPQRYPVNFSCYMRSRQFLCFAWKNVGKHSSTHHTPTHAGCFEGWMTEKVENSNFQQNFTRDSKNSLSGGTSKRLIRPHMTVSRGRWLINSDLEQNFIHVRKNSGLHSQFSGIGPGGHKNTHLTWNCYFEGRMTEKEKKIGFYAKFHR
jgi:hypothetical protein